MNDIMESKNELMEILGADTLSVQQFDQVVIEERLTFPLTEMFSLGSMFSSLVTALNGSKTLYQATFPVAGRLAAAKDGSGLLGTILNEKGIAGQARFHEVKGVTQTAPAVSQMFMAMAIMAINKSLEEIADNQKTIIAFLEIDKQAQLKGDLIVLSDIINEYQHNWENQQFLSNREVQVLDIKRSAEQNILFYRDMITRELAKKKFVRFNVDKALNDLQMKFKYYQLAVYLYSFSSFLDVMLLENFDSAYLMSVAERIRNYSKEYETFLAQSMEGVGGLVETSVQSRVLQGLSKADGFLGKQIAKIPDKENRIKIDDYLNSESDKMSAKQKLAVERTKDDFSSSGKNEALLFADKIELINKMYNEPLKICFDSENIYLQVS